MTFICHLCIEGVYHPTFLESSHNFEVHFCSSQGQNLETSIDIAENLFSLVVATLGLCLFAIVIGIMQVSFVAFYCSCCFLGFDA